MDSEDKKPKKKSPIDRAVDKALKMAKTIETNRATELVKFHERFDTRHRDMRTALSDAVLDGLQQVHPWHDPVPPEGPSESS